MRVRQTIVVTQFVDGRRREAIAGRANLRPGEHEDVALRAVAPVVVGEAQRDPTQVLQRAVEAEDGRHIILWAILRHKVAIVLIEEAEVLGKGRAVIDPTAGLGAQPAADTHRLAHAGRRGPPVVVQHKLPVVVRLEALILSLDHVHIDPVGGVAQAMEVEQLNLGHALPARPRCGHQGVVEG